MEDHWWTAKLALKFADDLAAARCAEQQAEAQSTVGWVDGCTFMVNVMCRDIIFVVETWTIRWKTFVATPVRQNGPGCAFERALRGGIPDHVCLFVPMPLVCRRLFYFCESSCVAARSCSMWTIYEQFLRKHYGSQVFSKSTFALFMFLRLESLTTRRVCCERVQTM